MPIVILRRVVVIVALANSVAATAAESPAIFWASSPVRPDETVLFAGHALVDAEANGAATTVELAPLDGPPGSPPTEPGAPLPAIRDWQPQPLVRGDAESVACVVPAAWPQAVWACRIRRGDAVSEPVLVNAPAPWWLQGDAGEASAPEGVVRVFGHSLHFAGAGTPAAALRGADGTVVPLTVTEATPYALALRLPASVATGTHALWVHNGLGGPAAWRLAGMLPVVATAAWKTDRFDVRDFGPKPEEAIPAAIAKARENGGGIVHLPRGRYGLTKPLDIPDGVVLAGEATDLVSLYWPDFADPPPHLVTGGRYGLENLTLYCQNHRSVVVTTPQSDGFFIRRVRIRANCHFMIEKPGEPFRDRTGPASHRNLGAGIAVHGRNFEIRDCDVLASDFAIFLKNARQGRIAGNTFLYGGRGYRIESSREIVFEDNTVEGFGLTAIGNDIATFWSNACTHIFFAGNRLRRMFGADREMMTLDAGGGAYQGGVAAADGTRLTLAADPVFKDYAPRPHQDWTGACVAILAGRGVGQYRLATGHEGRDWKIDRPWTVAPDATSRISIVPWRGRNVFIGNACEDGGPFQLYGSAHECIVAENTGRRMDGFLVWGLDPHGWGQQPSWYCQFLDNRILEGNAYGHRTGGFGTAAAGAPDDGKGRSVRDVVFRRNTCANNASIAIGGNLHGALVEHNTIEHADVGITVRPPATGVILRGNTLCDVRTPLAGPGLPAATVVPERAP